MALSYKTRRRLSLLALFVGLPAYIIAAIVLVNWIGEMHIIVEFLVYVVLGVLWAIPLKSIFKGVGKPDPDA